MIRFLQLALVAFLTLGAGPPVIIGPEAGVKGGGGGGSGGTSNPVQSVSLDCTPSTGTAPFSCQATVSVGHNGTLGQAIYSLDCGNGTDPIVSPPTFGTPLTPFIRTYAFEGTCDYVTADTYHLVGELFSLAMVSLDSDATDIVVAADTTPAGSVAIFEPFTTVAEESCTLPCADQAVSGLAYNGDTSYAWKADLDDSCASATTDCANPCWETSLASNAIMSPAVTIGPFTGVGIKQVRLCVLDERPSSDFAQLTFEAISSTSTLVCTAALDPVGGAVSPTNNVEPSIECSGGTSASGCNITGDCDIATAGGSTTLVTNSFETTGADGCDDATSSTGVTSCAGGTATAGTGTSSTNAIFFHDRYVSTPEQIATLDDLTIITDSANANQRRWNLRDGATNTYMLGTANPAINSLRLECPGNTCTTTGGQYTDGVPFDVRIHVLNTATGLAAIEDSAGNNLCTCTGTVAGLANGYVVNGGQAQISVGGYTVTTPTGASDLTSVTANTTWPYNWTTEATEDCDGYTTGTKTARFTAACPDADVQVIDVPFTVAATPTFVPSISLSPLSATLPENRLDDVTITATGTATGNVTGSCTVNGESVVVTATALPWSLKTNEGWAGTVFEDSGAFPVSCTLTRQAVTQVASRIFTLSDAPPDDEPSLEMGLPIDLVIPTGNTPAPQTWNVTNPEGSAVAYTCVENPPRDWISLNTCCSTTPAETTANFTRFAQAGRFCTSIDCRSDVDSTVRASKSICVTASTPTSGDPPYIVSRSLTGKPQSNPSYGYPSGVLASVDQSLVTFELEQRDADQSGLYTLGTSFNTDHTKSILVHEKTVDRLGGRPESTTCVPASACGDTNNGCGTRDAANFPWSGLRSKVLWVKRSEFKNAWQTCPNSAPNNPHSDGLQGWANRTCPYEHAVFQDGATYNVDSSQAMLFTEHYSGQFESTPHPCRFKTWTLQNWRLGPNNAAYTTACNTRAATPGSGGFTCSGSNNLLPASVQGARGSWNSWIIGGSGTGRCTGCELIFVATDSNRITLVNGGVKRSYTSLEQALVAENNLGEWIPPFLGYSAAGWANPPALATPVASQGDPN